VTILACATPIAPSLGLAAALVAGCGSLPAPFAALVPPDALHPNDPAQPVAPAVPAAATADPAVLGDLGLHRATWKRLGIDDYSMTVIYGCDCDLAGRPIVVTVAGGQLVSASDAGVALDLDRLIGFPATVDALFDYAASNANAGKIEFAWDDELGLPTAIGIDPDLEARDDEVRIAVQDFAVTR